MGYGEDDDLPGPAGPPEGPAGIKVKKKKKKAPRNGESDHPMLAFIPQRNRFQDALLCREGRGPWWSKGYMGVGCLELRPAFRCEDCFGGRLSQEPETVATLSLLRRFHTLNLQGRVPGYDFYNALVVLSKRAGMIDIPQFTLIVREYRHLQMCKRGGRGHDTGGVPVKPGSSELLYGINTTQPGELSIPCCACPHPEINMLPGWRELPPDRAWINQILLSEDANFKMKGRATSSREVDPMLGLGFAYMVASDEYLTHLAKYVDEDEISHCVAFAALWRANNKQGKGLRATGIGSVSCSRHEMFRPNGTGDLQKGERYDIACQWGINFWERMKKMPAHMRLPAGVKVQFKVPKFHLPPHVKKCHGPYSFNFTKWVGRTDGEGVERNWSWLNMAARLVSVMGPGSREDTIDDFCGFTNWRKMCGLGNSLLRKMVLYIPRAMIHNRAFQAFTDGLKEKHEMELVDWKNLVKAWEQDHGKPCLYNYPEENELTMDQVRLRIAEEAHARMVEDGESKTNSPGVFILAAMEIEGQQETILLEVRRRNRTSIQAAELQRKCTLLLTMVGRFRDEQAHFMPGIATWLAERPAGNKAKLESIGLYLPSSFAAEVRAAMCLENQGGEWEQTFQTLHFHDVRGTNERALSAEEKEEEHRARALAGLPPAEEAVDEYGNPVEQTVLFNLETGEGRLLILFCVPARARADCWREELLFLEEEMCCVLQFCTWKANWWDERRYPRPGVSPELAEGLCAYAKEQVVRERRWEQKWVLQWAPVCTRAQLALSDVLVDVEDALEVELEDEGSPVQSPVRFCA
ncbi:hypothetical protein DFH09DRAFT_1332844 [Mycena vulgaris]|nr:hypothetical protein DFH09DRAFT_1332844 [Mycena vulgaris]